MAPQHQWRRTVRLCAATLCPAPATGAGAHVRYRYLPSRRRCGLPVAPVPPVEGRIVAACCPGGANIGTTPLKRWHPGHRRYGPPRYALALSASGAAFLPAAFVIFEGLLKGIPGHGPSRLRIVAVHLTEGSCGCRASAIAHAPHTTLRGSGDERR